MKLGKRIMVVGCAGSGKSTLSVKLAKLTGLPLYHLDKLYWQPNWKESPSDVWIPLVEGLAANDRWIIDGNYQSTIELRLQRADTVVFLDFSSFACVKGVVRRVCTYHGKQRLDMGDGCKEKLDLGFLIWVSRFYKKNRPNLIEKINKYSHLQTIVLKNRDEVNEFEKNLKEFYDVSGQNPI